MAINYDALMKYRIPDVVQSLTPRDTMFYALSLGVCDDPSNVNQLRFVHEKNLHALPMMAVILCATPGWLRQANIGMSGKSVHGEQRLTLCKPLPVEGQFIGKSTVTAVIDKGPGKAALVTATRNVYDQSTNELLCSLDSTTVCRGDGGFDGPSGPARVPHEVPHRTPDSFHEVRISRQAALLYRLNGDRSPLHGDPEAARAAGFPGPIVHGLLTFGIAGWALVREACGYDPDRLLSMEVRFSAPVFPGELVRTEIWRDGTTLSFRSSVPARGATVIDNGRAELRY